MSFVVTAYRWGWANGHRYTVGVFLELDDAKRAGLRVYQARAGKYAIEIVRWCGESREEGTVDYWPSQTERGDAEGPTPSARLELAAHIGATVLCRWDAETELEDHRGEWPSWLVEHLPHPRRDGGRP